MEDDSLNDKLTAVSLNENSLICAKRIEEKYKNKLQKNEHNYGDSEAGPDIATGITSSDLKCVSDFFNESSVAESKIKNNALYRYNQEYSPDNKFDCVTPPCEERSAPEGTCSPDPKISQEEDLSENLMKRSSSCSNCQQQQGVDDKLDSQSKESLHKIQELSSQIEEEKFQAQKLASSRDSLLMLVEQYKAMIAALISDKEKTKSEKGERQTEIEEERDQAIQDLHNVEAAFSDVHRKYERAKQIIDTLRRNENSLKNQLEENEKKFEIKERKFEAITVKQNEKLEAITHELDTFKRANDQEMTKMAALLRKAEMKVISLQENLERKTIENEELSQLCDDLIQKVGS